MLLIIIMIVAMMNWQRKRRGKIECKKCKKMNEDEQIYQLILGLFVASSVTSCPCLWDPNLSSLECSGKGLQSIPTECFAQYPSVTKLYLNGNSIKLLSRDDFKDAIYLEEISISDNPLSGIHPDTFSYLGNLRYITILSNSLSIIQPKLFWYNPNLIGVNLGSGLKSMPKELFSPNITNVMTVDLSFSPQLAVTPCKMIEHIHPESYINASISTFWAQTTTESQNCLWRPNIVSQCFLVTNEFTGCENLSEDISPVMAKLALTETGHNWNQQVPSYITFPAVFESLLGYPPDATSCLPKGTDKIWDFQIYYQNTEYVYLDTLYFDLADLQYFTSYMTKSVTIRADTVVLSREIPAIAYTLKVAARNIVLRYSVKSLTNTNSHNPATDINYYTSKHNHEKLNGLVVERFQHANIEMILLDSPSTPCNTPPNLGDVASVSSLVQLDLTVQCASGIMKSDSPDVAIAFRMAKWAEEMSTSNKMMGMQQIRSRATTIELAALSLLTNYTNPDPLPVPYLTLNVYSDMVDDLSQNIQIFKNTMDHLQDKIELQAAAMFDMSMSFAKRHDDLEYVYQTSKTALNNALNVYGSHLNHLNNILAQAESAYGLTFDVYTMFDESILSYNTAMEKLNIGLEIAYTNAFVRGCRNLFVNLGNCFTGQAEASDIINSIYEAGDFMDEIKDMQDELATSMALINDLMDNVNAIMHALTNIDPDGTGNIDWSAAFPDTTPLVRVAASQFISKNQWDTSIRGALILLDDEDMKKVYGANDYRVASLELAEWGNRLSENIKSLSLLILQIKIEEENIKILELAVEEASTKTDEIGNMMSIEETNEQNYLEVLRAQNEVLMNLMLDYYTRIRADMIFMSELIDEYCSAYKYSFFIECSPETKPTAEDSYDSILLKLGKLQIGALDSISSLNPPPQPFIKSYEIKEKLLPFCSGFMENCPVTSLATKRTTSFVLSDWWGTQLSSFDRVRIDTLRFYLVGASTPLDTSIVLQVTQPSVFNDTFKGDTFTFTGHATDCVIMYRQEDSASIDDATYLTDCSTHHSFKNYYTRSTPKGLYTLSVISPDTDTSNIESIQVYVEGSWMAYIQG